MWDKLFQKKITKYVAPSILKKWVNDVPDGELYETFIQDDNSVWSATGRYAHSSGSVNVTWEEFKAGKIDDLIKTTMGNDVLEEMHKFIKNA